MRNKDAETAHSAHPLSHTYTEAQLKTNCRNPVLTLQRDVPKVESFASL